MAYDWGKTNSTPIKTSSKYDWSKGETGQERTQKERQDLLSKGLPVSVNKDKAEPSMGGNILRGIIKPAAKITTAPISAAQELLGKKETQPLSSNYLGKVYAPGRNPNTTTVAGSLKDTAGTFLEVASNIPIAKGITLAREPIKQFLKQTAPKLAKEGFVQGVLQNAGEQLQQNATEGRKFSIGDVAKSGVTSAVAAPVLGKIVNTVFGKKASSLTPEQQANVRNFGTPERPNVPSAGKAPVGYMDKNVQQLPAPRTPDQIPIELPAEGILKGQQVVRDFNKPNDVTLPIPQKGGKKTLTNKGFSNIDSQPIYNTVYHGGEKINQIDLGKSNFGRTFFVTDNFDYAKEYANKYKNNGVVNNIEIRNDANLIDIKNAPKEVINKIREIGNGKLTGKIISIKKPDGSIINIPERTSASGGYGSLSFNETLDGAIRGKSHYAEDPNLVKIYKELGYDGMVSYEDIGMRGKNIGIWNDNVIKIPNKVIPKTPSPEIKAPINEPTANNINKKVSSALEKDLFSAENPNQFKRGTFDEWSNRIIEKDFDEVVDIALGNKLPTDDIPKGAYYSAVRTIANETGDTNLQLKLALESDVPSKLGQDLGSLRIASERDTISILRDIKAAKEVKMGIKDIKKSQQLKSDLKKSFDKVLKEFEGTVPTREDVIKILDDITCK